MQKKARSRIRCKRRGTRKPVTSKRNRERAEVRRENGRTTARSDTVVFAGVSGKFASFLRGAIPPIKQSNRIHFSGSRGIKIAYQSGMSNGEAMKYRKNIPSTAELKMALN